MNELSIANIEYLKVEISKSGITFSHLLDDLIDHVCCDVESEMQNGLAFSEAYDKVKRNFGIEGLIRIQHDTLYLIDKNYRIMKKTMKIFGVIAPAILSIGALFKIEHWPGAGILIVLGFFLLSFLFLPSAIYVSYKEVSNKTRKWLHITGFIGTFLLSLSFLFKIMHWPGAGILIVIGVAFICFVFLPATLYNKMRDKELIIPKYIVVMALIGLSIYILGFFSKMMHWPGAAILFMLGALLLVFLAFPLFTKKSYADKSFIDNSFIFIVLVLIWFVIPTTLIVVNAPKNAAKSLELTNIPLSTDVSVIEKLNNNFYTKNSITDKYKNVKILRQDIIAQIQKLKTLIENHDYETLSKSEKTDLLSIQIKIEKYQMLLSSVAPQKKSQIDQWLDKSSLKNFALSTPVSLERLSFLQVNILMAESSVLNK